MRLFRCPECGHEVKTRGHSVSHECKGKWRQYEEVKEDK